MSEQVDLHEKFAALLDESIPDSGIPEGSVVKGTITAIERGFAVVDVSLKVEGRIPIKEFAENDEPVKVGDSVEVYLERIESASGEAIISREKAKREERWVQLEEAFANKTRVTGFITDQVRGGFTVGVNKIVAFLPQSQVDTRPIRDINHLMHSPQMFQILKMDKGRWNIILSRRAILEEARAEQNAELVQSLKEGQTISGIVKNITGYGAFIDLGGIDGLLHVTDIAWRRVNHPEDVLSLGQTVEVRVLRVNTESKRISLGMKQLEEDPWNNVNDTYQVGALVDGTVTNIADYGAFVELEPGVEGLVHVSEMAWSKKVTHPGKVLSTSQQVTVRVLDVDKERRRISLGLKQVTPHPYVTFMEKYPVGSTVKGLIKSKADFGLIISLDEEIGGLVHLSNLDWVHPGELVIREYQVGSEIETVVLEIDVERERVSLGVKQLTKDPMEELEDLEINAVVDCEVVSVEDNGIKVVLIDTTFPIFIKQLELALERDERDPTHFYVGQRLKAHVLHFDRKNRVIQLSIRALEVAEEEALKSAHLSTGSGSSLGDVLGGVLFEKKPSYDDDEKSQ